MVRWSALIAGALDIGERRSVHRCERASLTLCSRVRPGCAGGNGSRGESEDERDQTNEKYRHRKQSIDFDGKEASSIGEKISKQAGDNCRAKKDRATKGA